MTAQSQASTATARQPDLAGILRADGKIRAILPPTPLLPVEIAGARIWCKAESLQPIGAFKIRGAWHRLSDMTAEERAAGVVAFSSGNHAQGIAWSARRLAMPATIVMPADAPLAKVESTRAMGARVIFYDRMTERREVIAERLARDSGAILVPSFDDPWVVEGQGTTALEAARQMEEQTGKMPTQLVICCGGGGLASGCALAVPDARITIVEPEGWDDFGESLRHGAIVPVGPNPPPTRCDALQTLRIAPLTFDILQARGASGVAVSEPEVADAMRFAMTRLGLVLEPGGAVALAAVLAGKIAVDDATIVTLSGRNVDPATYCAMIGT
ncbi:threonine ammonia-lyase [Sphingobium algorifonticola]|uniref:Threonine/serine dehydratase n=1 Tax=Sphingobium algorifonticola TaxID=2008318 RepID=A0A437J6P7_9SPHN|nr:threonine/serine dehydratase [Sphingobium algorifonticola]RVT40820.1 threonine/serine dehydratase [Sphingobium algorifonticola]